MRDTTGMTEPQFRVGVIGCGRKGTVHARSYDLDPRATIVAGADTDRENLDLFCERFNVPGYDSYEEMVKQEGIDIALPILPVSPNAEIVIRCARLGVKGIGCEKPMAASLAQADEMVAQCRAHDVALAVGDLDVNLPHYARAREYINSGSIGEIRTINLMMGSGAQLSGGHIQQFSLARYFAGGADVDWVIGWVNGDPHSDEDQGGAGFIRFANGVEAFMDRQDTARYGFELRCAGGTVVSDYRHVQIWKVVADDGPTKRTFERVEGVVPESELYEGSKTYDANGWRVFPRNNATARNLIDAIENGTEPAGSGDNGRKALEIAIAMRESHRRGHVPVHCPLPDRSMRIVPSDSRNFSKKQTRDRDAYMAGLRAQKVDPATR